MNEYVGKTCPFCKSSFEENDDIVVCSDCDMPHHKECWIENEGCTTFGCMGTIKGVDNKVNSVTAREISYEDQAVSDPVPDVCYCTKCGAGNRSDAIFCSQCGLRILTSPEVANSTGENENYRVYSEHDVFSDEEVCTFIGENNKHYIAKFRELEKSNSKASWNWAAFFFAPYWLLYRKMYGYGCAFFLVSFLLCLDKVLSVFAFAACIGMGIFGDFIYMNEIKKHILECRAMSENDKTRYIFLNSGVNAGIVLVGILVHILLSALVSA